MCFCVPDKTTGPFPFGLFKILAKDESPRSDVPRAIGEFPRQLEGSRGVGVGRCPVARYQAQGRPSRGEIMILAKTPGGDGARGQDDEKSKAETTFCNTPLSMIGHLQRKCLRASLSVNAFLKGCQGHPVPPRFVPPLHGGVAIGPRGAFWRNLSPFRRAAPQNQEAVDDG